jgi:hypothetical protein
VTVKKIKNVLMAFVIAKTAMRICLTASQKHAKRTVIVLQKRFARTIYVSVLQVLLLLIA